MHSAPNIVAPPLTDHRRETILDGMRGRTVVVLGDAMLDRYLEGDSDRLSPEAPVPVVSIARRHEAPGGAANVAANLAALGARPRLISLLGDDPDGATLRIAMVRAGIDASRVLATPDRPTTVKTRVVSRGQQVVRFDEEITSEVNDALATALLRQVDEALAGADAFVIEDYNKGLLTGGLIRNAMGLAGRRGLPIIVDPKYRHFFEYAGATVFKPNRRELAEALGAATDPTNPGELAALVTRLDVGQLLLTLGAQGMLLVGREGAPTWIPGHAREVFDVSGAGDTVTAWLAAGLAAGASVVEAATLANRAAGIEVGKRGVAVVTAEEVRAATAGLPPSGRRM